MAKIHASINGVGDPTFDVRGATGTVCKALTKPLEDAFKGGKVKTTNKPELYQTTTGQGTELKASV